MSKSKVAIAMAKTEAEWQTEDDLRTLSRAAEIKKDPARLKRVQELAKKKLLALASVAGGSEEAAEGE